LWQKAKAEAKENTIILLDRIRVTGSKVSIKISKILLLRQGGVPDQREGEVVGYIKCPVGPDPPDGRAGR